MVQFVKLIDDYNVFEAPVNYEYISNFNLDENIMREYGFLPLEIIPSEKTFEFPAIKYTKYEDKIVGEYVNKLPTVDEFKQILLKDNDEIYLDVIHRKHIYIGDYIFSKDLYPLDELIAMDLSEESFNFTDLNGDIHLLNHTQVHKYLKDKMYIEHRFEDSYREKINTINECQTIEDLKKINLGDYPTVYFKINECHDTIRDEKILEDATGLNSDLLNICAYFSEETRVYYGDLGIRNVDYLTEHNIPYIKLSYGSGTIVGLAGDLNLSIISTKPITNKIIDSICSLLRDQNLNISVENNDILIDGKKCCGCAGFFPFLGEMNYYKMYIHISFNLDRELIEMVRVKPQTKELIGINEALPTFTRKMFLDCWKEKLNELGYRSV